MADSIPPSERLDSGPVAEIELTRHRPPAFVDHSFGHLELDGIGGADTPPIEIVSGLEWPQLHARYVVVQEATLREEPQRGWAPVGGVYSDRLLVGPSDTSPFDFGSADGTGDGVLVWACDTFLSLTACGDTVAIVRVGIADLLTAAEASVRSRQSALID